MRWRKKITFGVVNGLLGVGSCLRRLLNQGSCLDLAMIEADIVEWMEKGVWESEELAFRCDMAKINSLKIRRFQKFIIPLTFKVRQKFSNN